MSEKPAYDYRWVTKKFELEEILQLLIDRIALLEGRVRELEDRANVKPRDAA